MKVTSTLRTDCFDRKPGQSRSVRSSSEADQRSSVLLVLGHIVRYLVRAVCRLPVSASPPPPDAKPFGLLRSLNQRVFFSTDRGLSIGMRVEPPDGQHPPTSYTNQFLQLISLFTMNEQPLLNGSSSPAESPHDVPSGSSWFSMVGRTIIRRAGSQEFQAFGRFAHRINLVGERGWAIGGFLLLLMMLTAPLSVSAQTPTVNLSLTKKVSNNKPNLNDVITYTVTVANSGPQSSSGVVVKDSLSVLGAQLLTATPVGGAGMFTVISANVGLWNVGTLAANQSATLIITAKVIERGVSFNTAEIIAASGIDANSLPGNHSLVEDDYANACFSVPLLLYEGEEYSVYVPYAGFNGTRWYKDGAEVGTNAVPSNLASLNGDTLIIKSTGTYSFVTSLSGCATGNCCDIIVVPGPLAALGDFVWLDNDRDGQQGANEPGVPNVSVTLYSSLTSTPLATTATDANGKYLFTNLLPGEYYVVFTTPTGYSLTMQNSTNPLSGTIADTVDSDASPVTGRTQTYTLAGGETNLTVDAGLVPLKSTLGDYVWLDTNRNGIQDSNETGVASVTVTLYNSNSSIVGTYITGSNGSYLFSNLDAGCYTVRFTTPTGFTFTTAGAAGSTKANDSDVNPNGFTDLICLASGEVNRDVDAGLIPTCPTVNLTVSNLTICADQAASLVATSSVQSATINWYLTPTGGDPLYTTTSGQSLTVNPTTTTVYYAQAIVAGGCLSPIKPVIVTVTAIPPTPTCPERLTVCANLNQTINLATVPINQVRPGNRFEWRTGPNPATSTVVTNITAVGAGKYYLYEVTPNGCYSNPTVLTVDGIDCRCTNIASVTIGNTSPICEGGNIVLAATMGGSASSLSWTASGSGTFVTTTGTSTTYVPSAADLITGFVEFTVKTNDPDGNGICEAATSSRVVKINKRPDAPIGVACDDTLVCQGSKTKLIGFAPGNRINWYTLDGTLIGTTESGGKLTISPNITTVYYAEAVSSQGCVSRERSSVTVVVGQCLAELAVTKNVTPSGPYSVGQKITYIVTATNNGPIAASGVTVSDLLPASLSFVSATTPVGTYNAGTGIWTIGSLAVGASRNLFVEAVVKAGGSITNVAVISGTNDDPSKPLNNTATVTITVEECTTPPPHIHCAITEICKNGDGTTIYADDCAGTIIWSNGGQGKSLFVNPLTTTTYTASCLVGSCISKMSEPITITVIEAPKPIIVASTNSVCLGGMVSLTATGCEGGTIHWSTGVTGNVLVIENLETKTTFTATCFVKNCPSLPAEKTIDLGNNMPKPTVVCSATEVCPGEAIELTVQNCLGTPSWSTGETTNRITVRPTESNNRYWVICQNGTCSSPRSDDYVINIITPTKPTITPSSSTVCSGTSVTLVASGCNGRIIWSDAAQTTGNRLIVQPGNSISYFATCQVRSCSAQSEPVQIVVVNPTAPIISASRRLICSGESITLTATGCEGAVLWSGSSQTSAVIEVMPGVTTDYFAMCKAGSCTSPASNTIKVTVNTTGTAPTIKAPKTTACNGEVISLTALGCSNSSTLWSTGQSGAIVSVTVSATNNEFYAVCKQGDQCGSPRSNLIRVNLTTIPKPTVTCSDTAVCPGEVLTLTVQNCEGIPTWSTGQTTMSINVSQTVTTGYSVTCRSGACVSPSSDVYTIKVLTPASITVTASRTEIQPGENILLTALGCNGTVTWNIDGAPASTTLLLQPTATRTYVANCQYRTCRSEGSVTVTVRLAGCLAKAGTLRTDTPEVCASADKVVLTAVANGGLVKPNGYSVLYVLTKGTDRVIQKTSTTPSFTVTAENTVYTIHTLVYNANPSEANYLNLAGVIPGVTKASDVINLINISKVCADLDVTGAQMRIKSIPAPVLHTDNLTVCAGASVTITATGCEGGLVKWMGGQTGNALVVSPVTTAIWENATCVKDGCESKPSASIDIDVVIQRIPTIAADKQSICAGESVVLTAVGCEGGYTEWESTTARSASITVTPTVGNNVYRAKCVIGGCVSGAWSPSVTIAVGSPNAPTAGVLSGTTVVTSYTSCFGAPISLVANGCPVGSYVIWSNGNVGSTITVTPGVNITYTAQCCSSNNCKSALSSMIRITVLPKVAIPTTRDLSNTCPFNTVNLAQGVTNVAAAGNTFEFYTTETPSATSRVVNPNAVGISGKYYVFERSAAGCYSLPGVINVGIISCEGQQTPCDKANPITADAGADDKICAAKSYKLNGKAGGNVTKTQWLTSGSGQFDNPFALNPTYTPSLADVQAGSVTLTLACRSNNETCPEARDAMVLTIEGVKTIPTVSVVQGALNLCYGDSVILEASAGSGYLWNTKATTQRIVVKKSGSYTVQLVDAGGCTSLPSQPVVVNVADKVAAPIASNLRNTCPANTVNLQTALSSQNGTGKLYEFRTGESTNSPTVLNPTQAGFGTYYIFERTQTGCVSAPAKVEVKIFDCTKDTARVDLAITKTASNNRLNRGEIVTYTIKVTNTSSQTATNVNIRDVLPQGLELVPGAYNFNLTSGVITKWYGAMFPGTSETITFQARVIKKGDIVNTAEITYADQVDPVVANNKSSVTVSDTTTSFKASTLGIAKGVSSSRMIDANTAEIIYGFYLVNYGDETLTKVRVADDLSGVFATHSIEEATVTSSSNYNPTIKLNNNYTGLGGGNNIQMLDSASYLSPNATASFTLRVKVKLNANDTTRTFNNAALASALGGSGRIEDASVSGADPDPDGDKNPNNNTGTTTLRLNAQAPSNLIGVAMSAMSTKKDDGTYSVVYTVNVKNFGEKALNDIQLTNNLTQAFGAPAAYTVLGASVTQGSLTANVGFNGGSNQQILLGGSLAAGATGIVSITVNVQPNGNNGPFYNSVIAKGTVESTTITVQDVSNTGVDPSPTGEVPTAVRFDLPDALIGVAKSVGTPIQIEDGVFDVPYSIKLTNLGRNDLTNVQVVDDLAKTFNTAMILSSGITVSATTGLIVNPLYTGQGSQTKMLKDTTANKLAAGASRVLNFIVRVNVQNANTQTFYNSAIASAMSGSAMVADTSTAGTNPDPKNNLDPRTSNEPTPVVLNSVPLRPFIGVALAVQDTVRQADGSYNVTYVAVIKNYATVPMTNVSLTDSLSKVFNAQNGASFRVVGTAIATGKTGLKINPSYNGGGDANLLIPGSSSLAAGESDTIRFVVNVKTDGTTSTFLNSATAKATALSTVITDRSTNGMSPDLNGNRNPTDSNENEATPLYLKTSDVAVFIPEGFSPNGDGINDQFVIRGSVGAILLEVFNRWGHVVYKSDDYKNDWDGTSNTGVQVGNTGGLPDGTYFYRVKLSDGRQFVRYMTINR